MGRTNQEKTRRKKKRRRQSKEEENLDACMDGRTLGHLDFWNIGLWIWNFLDWDSFFLDLHGF